MSVCPVPGALQDQLTTLLIPNTSFLKPVPPAPVYEVCEGTTTTVVINPPPNVTPPPSTTTTICCPSPGPQGPIGPQGPPGPTLTLKNKGSVLGNITTLDIAGSGLTASISGSDGTVTSSCLVWTGDWAASVNYKVNDVVRQYSNPTADGYGNAYVCIADHTSSSSNGPPNAAYWEPMTNIALTGGDKTFLDNIKNVFDWIQNATVGDWINVLIAGTGIAIAGALILDAFTGDGTGDGQADSQYNGSPGYNGSFTAPNLQTVVNSIFAFAGYQPSQYDTSLLSTTQEVRFVIGKTTSLQTLLYQLQLVYQFDVVLSQGVFKCVPKNQPAVKTLTQKDLGHTDGGGSISGDVFYSVKRIQGVDLPRSITLSYYSKDLDHTPFSQTATLDTFSEGQDITIDVPFVLTDSEAKRIVESALVNAHLEQTQIKFTTDYYNIDLDAGDIVELPLNDGSTMNIRISKITETKDGLLEIIGVRSDYQSLTYQQSNITVSSPPVQTTNTPVSIGYSQTLFVEVPSLNTSDQQPRIYLLTHGYNRPGWPGAGVYQSLDGGASYSLKTTTQKIITFGLVSTAIPPPPNNLYQVWDDSTVITVQLKQGTLETKTDLAVYNGENWAMIGEELIGFVNATLVAPGTYQLSRLLRGRRGTEVKISSHVNNELFFLIEDDVPKYEYPIQDINKPSKWKTVTIGSDLSKVSAFDVTPYALNLRPWAVVNAKAVRQPNDDWIITWNKRSKFSPGLVNYTGFVNDPDFGGFGLAFKNASDQIVRTATTTFETYTYTAAQQITDFGSVQTNLKVSIVQMSNIQGVGGGYPTVLNV